MNWNSGQLAVNWRGNGTAPVKLAEVTRNGLTLALLPWEDANVAFAEAEAEIEQQAAHGLPWQADDDDDDPLSAGEWIGAEFCTQPYLF